MPQQPSFGEVGASGLFRQAGYITEEFLPGLAGRKAIDTYKEMRDNEPLVWAILFAIEMLLRQVEWSVEPNEDAAKPEDDAKFVEECMDDMSHTWSDLISEILSMLVFGWSFHEIVYKKRLGPQEEGSQIPSSKYNDGKIGWRKMPIRAQESLEKWEFDENGGIRAMVQRPAPTFEEISIPIIKGLLFRTSTIKNNPEGRSILRGCYRPWYYKKRMEEVEGVGVERNLAGLPFIGVDPAILADDATPAQKAILAGMVNIGTNVRADKQAAIIWPNVYDEAGNKVYTFELLSGGGGGSHDTSAIVQRYDQRIAMTVLADFILLGHEKVGSFALSSDKTDLFALALGAWLNMIADIFNRYAVPRLFALNGMDQEHLPEIKPGDIESPNLTEIASYIQTLVNAGVPLFPNEALEDHLMEIANLPEIPEELREEQELRREQMAEQTQQQEEPDPEEGTSNPGGGAGGSVNAQGNNRGTNGPQTR